MKILIKNTFYCVIALLLISSFSWAQETETSPKYIFILIGDGMGYNQVQAASLYHFNQTRGFAWQQFDNRLAMSTYHSNCSYSSDLAWQDFDYSKYQYTDSAAAATAMSTGHKTNRGSLGVRGNHVYENIMERAGRLGRATGVVTSVPISHATPAGFIIHNLNRRDYETIARDMFASSLDVIMGCGHPEYDDDGNYVVFNREYKYVGGRETWEKLNDGYYGPFIDKRSSFQQLATGNAPPRLIGVARVAETLQQERRMGENSGDEPFRDPYIETVPTLAEMARAAINVLDVDEDGFVLMVEGGAIDSAGHDSQKGRMIEETTAFDEMVTAVLAWVDNNSSWEESLVIVTADHETGYLTAAEGVSMAEPLVSLGFNRLPQMHFNATHHTNHLVPFFAQGKGSTEFSAVATSNDAVRGRYMDNTDMAKVLFRLLDADEESRSESEAKQQNFFERH